MSLKDTTEAEIIDFSNKNYNNVIFIAASATSSLYPVAVLAKALVNAPFIH